jgi:hypothetical protein
VAEQRPLPSALEVDAATAAPARTTPLWRRAFPFVLALGLIGWVVARIDWAAFAHGLATVDYPLYLLFMALFVVALLAADAFATTYIYGRITPISFVEMFLVRAASYVPSLLNHHIGQAWLTYVLAKHYGIPLKRVAGSTLVAYATWGGCILVLATVGLAAAGLPVVWLALPLGLGLGYLGLLAWRPARLASNAVLGPLFEAGVGGHLRAMALRVPHLVVLFVGTWVPFLFFGVHIPLRAALTYIPALMVTVALPLTPAGIGTRDALAAELLQRYVVGAHSEEERIATLAASTASVAVTLTVIEIVIGLAAMRRASRLVPARAPGRGSERDAEAQ